MSEIGCSYVRSYLEAFLDKGSRRQFSLQAIGDHVASCAGCYEALSRFFRTVELPEPEYLRETIDELALALYNLAKAIIRDRPASGPDDDTEGVCITEAGGGSEVENLEAGQEMIEDAEDYVGSSVVGGMDLEELRGFLQDAEMSRVMRIDLARSIFHRVVTMPSRYESRAWNWIGVLDCLKEDFDSAEGAFRKVLQAADGAPNVRSHAQCGLSYVLKQRGDLDGAIRAAEKAVVLSQEDGDDPYFGRFAGLYFHLLRGRPGDPERAEALLQDILAAEGEGAARLRRDLALASNAPVLETLRKSPFARRYPQVLPS